MKEIAALKDQAEQDFTETDKHLKDARLPQVILDRQAAVVCLVPQSDLAQENKTPPGVAGFC